MSLLVSGKDAESFLKAQSTNDLKIDQRNFSAFLKNKAEIVALTAIEKSDQGFYIYSLNLEELKSHLEKFIIIEDVAIS